MWFWTIIRNLFFALDNVIYYFISLLYELLMYLANIDLFGANADVVSAFLQRIYAILGIFMLFKVSFSVLQYVVDPNSFSDQSKGMGKLLRNVIVALVLLALTPSLFSLAFDLQSTILNSNIIGTLILGNSVGDSISGDDDEDDEDDEDEDDEDGTETINSINATLANDMRFLVFGAFFTVNEELIPECEDTPVLGTKVMAANKEDSGDGTCLEQVTALMNENSVNIYDFFRISDTEDNRDFESFSSLLSLSQDNKFYFKYQYIWSTIAGIFIVVMMLAYCFDVAVRVIKLFFLEIIAPIPIVSFVDPKQGKDGMLYRWAKECGSTYASLFIRLAAIFLAFFLIDLIGSMNFAADEDLYFNEDVPEGVKAALVQVMLVFGILIFAGQTPKLIEKIFGFEASGELGINPLKRITSSPLASAAAGGAIGAGAGLAANVGNLVAKGVRAKQAGPGGFRKEFLGVKPGEFSNAEGIAKAGVVAKGAKRFASNSFSPVGGLVSGAIRTGYTGRDGNIGKAIKKGHEEVINRREARDARQDQSISNRVWNRATQFVGTKNEFGGVGKADEHIKNLKERLQQVGQTQAVLRENFAKKADSSGIDYEVYSHARNNKELFDYEAYKKAAGASAISEATYDNMSYFDRYQIIPGNLSSQIDPVQEADFNDLMTMQRNLNASKDDEKAIEKQIKDTQRAAGIKSKDES